MPYPTLKEVFVRIDAQLNGFAKFILIVGGFVCLLAILDGGGRFVNRHILGITPADHSVRYTYITVSPSVDMEVVLKKHDLWDIDTHAEIAPVVFNRYPSDPPDKGVNDKKKIFFHVLLPAVLVAQAEVKQERRSILDAIDQLGKEPDVIEFACEQLSWQQGFALDRVNNLLAIAEKYQDSNAAALLEKVDVIPVSLILAQSAIESAWGESRFAVNGNNMFGIWTWGQNGIVPKKRESGKKHRVAVFVSILDSVRAYTLILNKVPAYRRFRKIRRESRDSLDLVEGLLNYSSRRSLYVRDVKNIITRNNLKRYDTVSIAL